VFGSDHHQIKRVKNSLVVGGQLEIGTFGQSGNRAGHEEGDLDLIEVYPRLEIFDRCHRKDTILQAHMEVEIIPKEGREIAVIETGGFFFVEDIVSVFVVTPGEDLSELFCEMPLSLDTDKPLAVEDEGHIEIYELMRMSFYPNATQDKKAEKDEALRGSLHDCIKSTAERLRQVSCWCA